MNRFSEMKKEWGFQELISMEAFGNPCNGYLVDDCCVFGAEICVIDRTCKLESVSMVKETPFMVKEFVSMVKEPVSKPVSVVKETISNPVSMAKEPVSKPVSMLKEPASKPVSMVKEPVSTAVVEGAVIRTVSVVKEHLLTVKEPVYIMNVNGLFTWKLEKFSTLHNYAYESNVFRVGGKNWYVLCNIYFPFFFTFLCF